MSLFKVKLLILIVELCLSVSVNSFNLTILHNNDFHARYTPINKLNGECDPERDKVCFGGVARTVAKVSLSIFAFS